MAEERTNQMWGVVEARPPRDLGERQCRLAQQRGGVAESQPANRLADRAIEKAAVRAREDRRTRTRTQKCEARNVRACRSQSGSAVSPGTTRERRATIWRIAPSRP